MGRVRVVVVVPSRGRPDAALATVQACLEAALLPTTQVVVAIDEDDPTRREYEQRIEGRAVELRTLARHETGNLVRATNTVSLAIARRDPQAIIGNLGDDHRPRTIGWDLAIHEALETPGMAYGDDLIHGANLPSAPFVSAQLVAALGWYFHPALEHMYVDDTWRELATAAGCRRYLADVVIEHMHPDVGKGEWDELYRKVNAEAAVFRDRQRYQQWLRDGLIRDAERIRNVLQAAA